ncbi:MAG: ABC-2 family transporter protein [Planctomycetes bacterium]|nr:ABC-2 family transporter protein [Planctomycetota bacterium]MCH9727201.1 ABC-2 family transporter protein [Planctomycetota bacterium]MCH9778594.1 ABC-2 family transporter protein [Planctomycetota bacterium]MCH9790969.1 ABC-2 family transporter protein [Planctomycetota bacterium]
MASSTRPHYGRVWITFLQNSLIREMTFRGNLLITIVTRGFWFAAQLVLFDIIYRNVNSINDWSRGDYFAFMATGMLINAIVETFFMPNCAHFSELIRNGNLDFVLLKPIDTQFLVSFEKVNLAMLNQVLLAGALLCYSLLHLSHLELILPALQNMILSGQWITLLEICFQGTIQIIMYLLLLAVGVAFFYSLMIALASSSIWFGRNQGLYDFWFYITVFARYPRSIYSGSPTGEIIRFAFSYVIPILLVVTVPSRLLLSKALEPSWITLVSVLITIALLFISRFIFKWSLNSYRSASS